ncbi:MAG: c-type cytochrome [Verrucomicrobiota bacterium]
MRLPRGLVPAFVVAIGCGAALRAAEPEVVESMARGQALYVANCSICHGVTGDGVRGTYPPLAKSDWLAANRTGAVRAVVAGLKAEIVVNGTTYRGQMPPIVLDDAQAADVVTFVLNSWGNAGGRVTRADVTAIRALTEFRSFEALRAAADYRPLPKAPDGFELTELVRLNDFGVRLASDGKGGPLYILGRWGGVWRFDTKSGNLKQIMWPKEFTGDKTGDFSTLGMVLDAGGRLWITSNQRVNAKPLAMNEVTIYHTTSRDAEGDPVAPKVWFQTKYPWGIGPYTHGLSDIRFGADGMLYASNGSRTDAGETGEVPNLSKGGEVEITGAMWRLDPKTAQPKIEVIARGIRNAFTFAWDGSGNLFTVSNGPDAHAPEEMDHIVPPKPGGAPRHHGFPYQFGDAPVEKKWYAHAPVPPAPEGVTFVLPVLNLGPAGLMGGQPTSTFNAHSSPTGLVWLGNEWPESVRNGFLVGRLGSFLLGPGPDEEHGFDVLHMKMAQQPDGRWTARTTTFLAPLGRPIDVHVAGPGRLYILEFTRPTSLKNGAGWLPGRILELKVKGVKP